MARTRDLARSSRHFGCGIRSANERRASRTVSELFYHRDLCNHQVGVAIYAVVQVFTT